jgi:hypothetical protein
MDWRVIPGIFAMGPRFDRVAVRVSFLVCSLGIAAFLGFTARERASIDRVAVVMDAAGRAASRARQGVQMEIRRDAEAGQSDSEEQVVLRLAGKLAQACAPARAALAESMQRLTPAEVDDLISRFHGLGCDERREILRALAYCSGEYISVFVSALAPFSGLNEDEMVSVSSAIPRARSLDLAVLDSMLESSHLVVVTNALAGLDEVTDTGGAVQRIGELKTKGLSGTADHNLTVSVRMIGARSSAETLSSIAVRYSGDVAVRRWLLTELRYGYDNRSVYMGLRERAGASVGD